MIIHTPTTFLKFGWKQPSTWIGLAILIWFIYSFYGDIHTLIHNVLINPELVVQIIGGIGGVACILFNRFKNKNDTNSESDSK